MVTITNGCLTAQFNEIGAELKSLVCNGTEYMWPGDPNVWKFSAPIMFPVCGGLVDDEYLLDGKRYSLPKHGFARISTFAVEQLTGDSVTFLLRANEETRKCYPFAFEFRVSYQLEGKSLKVSYDVKNLSADTMYFSVGSHEAYYCPEGIEAYDVILPNPENWDSTLLEGAYLTDKIWRVAENTDTLSLKYEYFTVDTLIFLDMKAKSVILRNRNTGRALQVSFEGNDYFQIWTKQGAPYICLEPWCGVADRVDTDKNIKTKLGILRLPAAERLSRAHTMEILV